MDDVKTSKSGSCSFNAYHLRLDYVSVLKIHLYFLMYFMQWQ